MLVLNPFYLHNHLKRQLLLSNKVRAVNCKTRRKPLKKQVSRKNYLCPELSRYRSLKSNLQLTSMIRKTSKVFDPILLKLNPKAIYLSNYSQLQKKKLHLFGSSKEIEKLSDIEAACITFEIRVTGEVLVTEEKR